MKKPKAPDTRDEIIAKLTVENADLRKIVVTQNEVLRSITTVAEFIACEAADGVREFYPPRHQRIG